MKIYLLKKVDSVTEFDNRDLQGDYENKSPWGVNVGFVVEGTAPIEDAVEFIKNREYNYDDHFVVGETPANSYMVWTNSSHSIEEIATAVKEAVQKWDEYCK